MDNTTTKNNKDNISDNNKNIVSENNKNNNNINSDHKDFDLDNKKSSNNDRELSNTDNGYSWAKLVKDFFDIPPTSSFFRLYILCFVIWNKSLIFYIVFAKADMSEKLLYINFSKYVLCLDYCGKYLFYSSVYLMPFLVMLLIYAIVFFKIKRKPFNSESIYYFFRGVHLDKEEEFAKRERKVVAIRKEALDIEKENIERQKEILEKQKENVILKDDVFKKAPEPKDPVWHKDYDFFKKTTYFGKFGDFIQYCYYDLQKEYTEYEVDLYNYFKINNYLIKSNCVIEHKNIKEDKILKPVDSDDIPFGDIDTSYTSYIDTSYISYFTFSEKGEYYVQMYEFEKENR